MILIGDINCGDVLEGNKDLTTRLRGTIRRTRNKETRIIVIRAIKLIEKLASALYDARRNAYFYKQLNENTKETLVALFTAITKAKIDTKSIQELCEISSISSIQSNYIASRNEEQYIVVFTIPYNKD